MLFFHWNSVCLSVPHYHIISKLRSCVFEVRFCVEFSLYMHKMLQLRTNCILNRGCAGNLRITAITPTVFCFSFNRLFAGYWRNNAAALPFCLYTHGSVLCHRDNFTAKFHDVTLSNHHMLVISLFVALPLQCCHVPFACFLSGGSSRSACSPKLSLVAHCQGTFRHMKHLRNFAFCRMLKPDIYNSLVPRIY